MVNHQLVEAIKDEIIKQLELVPVGVSNRHVHLSQADFETLFGQGKTLTHLKDLKQPGQYAAKETVILEGPKGKLQKVRILGPLRKTTQIELSIADSFVLGIKIPVRESGNLKGSAPIKLIGPEGSVSLEEGAIAAYRHIHMPKVQAESQGYTDGQIVSVAFEGIRSVTFNNVMLRVSDKYALEMHLDVEEANAAGIVNGDLLKILR
ncbi:MAG: putative phosphotransacetylase [Clostridiales bacterium]|jgi:putative phosphotransacetylase|nr:putative phosphotransacetylase [Clostridiales bacterium]MDN5298674.1 putative phosphotransacetylase [Clostridiales bacterium]